MKSESDLNRRIRSVLCATGAMAVSVESGATQLGIPDIYVRTENTSAWIELKHLYYPIHYPFRVPFKPGQYSWLHRHYGLRGTSVLCIETIEHGILFICGPHIREVYGSNILEHCSLHLSRLDGRRIVDWIDSI